MVWCITKTGWVGRLLVVLWYVRITGYLVVLKAEI